VFRPLCVVRFFSSEDFYGLFALLSPCFCCCFSSCVQSFLGFLGGPLPFSGPDTCRRIRPSYRSVCPVALPFLPFTLLLPSLSAELL